MQVFELPFLDRYIQNIDALEEQYLDSELKGIISLMQKSDLTELEIELQDLKLRLARPNLTNSQVERFVAAPQVQFPPASVTQENAPKDNSKQVEENEQFKSPMVGTFYRKPSPDDLSLKLVTKSKKVMFFASSKQ